MNKDLRITIVDTDKIKFDYVLCYNPEQDKTIIWQETYLPSNGRLELASEAIVGWYYGEPDKELYMKYVNNLKAIYEV